MNNQQQSSGADGPRRLPPEVEKMLAGAKEMETVLSNKLAQIDAVSLEKSEIAKKEALKIKSDIEEIKRLSLIQTKEGDEALKVKIKEVNQIIETTTRRVTELQSEIVRLFKELCDELSKRIEPVKKLINGIPGLPEMEKRRMCEGVDALLEQARGKYEQAQNMEKTLKSNKGSKISLGNAMGREEVIKTLEEKIDSMLKNKSDEDNLDEPNTFKAEPRKKNK